MNHENVFLWTKAAVAAACGAFADAAKKFPNGCGYYVYNIENA